MKMKLAALILLSVVVQVPAAMYQTQDSVVVEGNVIKQLAISLIVISQEDSCH